MLLIQKRRTANDAARQVATVIRVYRRETLVGSLLLNEAGRLRRRTPDVSDAVVLKILVQHNRCGDSEGAVTDRAGVVYAWRVLGDEDEE
jgi:hypothetical protein